MIGKIRNINIILYWECRDSDLQRIYSQNHIDWSAVFQISYELEQYKWYDYKHYFSNNVYINIYLDKQNLIIY